MRKQTISLHVEESYKKEIKKFADDMHISLSSFLALAVNEYITKIKTKEKKRND